MLQDFKKHINASFSFLKGKRLLVACSGGLDSVVLTYLLKHSDFDLALAHCNFSLRASESDSDEDFVVTLADKLSIPVFTETFQTKQFAKDHKVSIQMAARQLRYDWFSQLLKSTHYEYVVTAHHADDALETFLINLSRGSGLRGLTGIPEINENIIRPLLPFSKAQILAYAKKENLYWREDSSNAASEYLRNALRLHVIPFLKETNSSILDALQKTQRNLRDSESLIQDYMSLVYNLVITENFDGYSIHLQKLLELPNTEALLYELLSPFGFTDFTALSALLTAQSGKQIFSETHRILKDRDVLLLTEVIKDVEELSVTIPKKTSKITTPIPLHFEIVDNRVLSNDATIFVDYDKLQFPLTLRKWKEGDSFQPFGMQGKKKLSKFFKDEKVSLVAKEKMYVLCSGNEILWVVGMRMDDAYKVTPQTQKILKITKAV
ncbi:tRNA lysidine(34) synthetase TilS [Jejudonia soesokkakensis]|uniref:tRNA(Ile)-lysidine synthase n=1 Tax=Jejudonia soesokkakensis TaxID=1323432 RepID=A0ABW2MXK5_9FLAO